MSAFGGITLTNRGRNLQSKAQTGVQLKYTRIAIGDGNLGSTSILDMNSLRNEKRSLNISKLKVLTGGRAVVGTTFTNQEITEGFYFRELGVFALDPDLGEILYCYANSGALAEYIPPGGGSDIIEKSIDVQILIGTASNVSAVIDSSLVYATEKELSDHVNNTGVHITTAERNKWNAAEANAIDWAKNFGLGDVAKDISNTDLNNLDATGFYRGTTLTNAPSNLNSSMWSFVINLKHSNLYKNQILISYANTPMLYVRHNSNGIWAPWQQLETTAGAQAKATAVQDWAKGFGLERSKELAAGVDLNMIVSTGFYRLNNAPVNGPSAVTVAYSQLFVMRGLDTITQMVTAFQTGRTFIRSGNPTDVGGNGTWTAWQELSTREWVQSFGLGSVAKVATDWNTIRESGFYAGSVNSPDGSTFFGIHTQHLTNYATQIAQRLGKTYTRSLENNVWGSWKEIISEETSYTLTKSSKDANGIFTVVEHRRNGGNRAKRSVLSSPNANGLYTVRTITYYGTDGTTVTKTEIYDLTYDTDDDLVSEVRR